MAINAFYRDRRALRKRLTFSYGARAYVEARQPKALHPMASRWIPIDRPSLSRLSLAVPTTIKMESPEHVES